MLLAAVFVIALPQPVQAAITTTFQLNNTDATGADAYLNQQYPTYNYGGYSWNEVRSFTGSKNGRTILKFNITSIPSGRTISSATLSLRLTGSPNASGRTYWAYRLTETDWVEGTNGGSETPGLVCWNDRKQAQLAWTSPGGTYTADNGTSATVPSSGWMAWTVTAQVQYAYSNSISVHFLIKDGTESSTTEYYALFNTESDSTYAPKLDVTYTAVPPTVTTQAASSVQATTATGNGNITDTGGENCDKRGFVYGTSSHSLPGNVAPASSGYASYAEDTGSFVAGAFTKGLTSLSTGTTYYARAYAHNSAGYSYGGEVSFLTKPAAPTNVAATKTLAAKVTITWTKSTGANQYHVWRGAADLGAAGDVATFDDTGGTAPLITAGSSVATDGSSTSSVDLSLSGTSVANGTTYTYKVVASNATGNSADSATDTGYRKATALTYQWNRSSGDADSGYSTIGGATASTYSDTAAPAPTITPGTGAATDGTSASYVTLSLSGQTANIGAGRYFTCTLVSTSASNTPQTATANRGYIGVGSLTYQWWRSSGDADSGYSSLSGATTAPYNDTTAPADGSGRYYKCVESATGATQQISSVDRGYRSSTAIEIRAQDYTTAVATITFPTGAPTTTVSNPSNDQSQTQTFGGAGTAKPVVTLVNTAGLQYIIWYNITTFTNGVVSNEYYLINTNGAACVNADAINNAVTFHASNMYSTGVTIASSGQMDLYLKVILSAVSGKSGNSTITILGEAS